MGKNDMGRGTSPHVRERVHGSFHIVFEQKDERFRPQGGSRFLEPFAMVATTATFRAEGIN